MKTDIKARGFVLTEGLRSAMHLADGVSVVGSDVGMDLYQSVADVFRKVLRAGRVRADRRRSRLLRDRTTIGRKLIPA